MSDDTIKIDDLTNGTTQENDDFEAKLAAAFAEMEKADNAGNVNVADMAFNADMAGMTANAGKTYNADKADEVEKPVKAEKFGKVEKDIKPEKPVKVEKNKTIKLEKIVDIEKPVNMGMTVKADDSNIVDDAHVGTLPVSLSIETDDSMLIRIANIGDRLPIKATKVFSTGNNIPDALAVRLYAGERPFAKDNRLVTELMLEGIKGLSNGRPVISIVVDIDLDRNIIIEATDEGSLTSTAVSIDNSWVPLADEIVEMVKDAKNNASADAVMILKTRKLHAAKESLCRAENEYKNAKKKLAGEDILKYRKCMKELRAKLKKVKPENMTDDIENSIMDTTKKLNELLYPKETGASE